MMLANVVICQDNVMQAMNEVRAFVRDMHNILMSNYIFFS
jgi:hypothetical protein